MDEEAAERIWTALVVHDAPAARRAARQKLRGLPLRVFQATDVFDALARFAEVSPDVVIAGLQMPGGGGIELLRRIREFTDVPVVILAMNPSVEACEEAILSGAQRFLPWHPGIEEISRVTLDLLLPRPRQSSEIPRLDSIRERRREDLRAHLAQLLQECQGNIARVAERLQKDRSTVIYHLRKLGLFDSQRRAGSD
jgi:two-component system KDP operon response regulator KdpE